MVIIYEYRKINDEVLILQFQFESHNVEMDGSDITGMSLDKYMSLDVWSQIYTKLIALFERYKSDTTKKLKSETITMERAQLELGVSWTKTRTYHKEMREYNKMKDCDLCPFVLAINVKSVSVLDKYRKEHSAKNGKINEQKSSTPLSSTSSARTSNESDSRSITINDTEEYVPEAIGSSSSIDSSLKYTPSAVSINNNITTSPDIFITSSPDQSSQEYTPTTTKIDIDSLGTSPQITYTPMPIEPEKNSSNYTQKHKAAAETGQNVREKKNRNDELFGKDSDSDPEQNGRAKYDRSVKSSPTVDSPNQQKLKQPKLLNFVTHRNMRKQQAESDEANGKDTNKKRKNNAISPIESTLSKTGKRSELNQLIALRQEFEKEQNIPGLDSEPINNLKEWKNEDISKTLIKFLPELKSARDKYSSIPDHKIDPTVKENNYLTVLHLLVTEEQQRAMYKVLRAKFCREKEPAITSDHENLLWKIMVPEWALQIFMDKFKMDRTEALQALERQELRQAFTDNTSEYDLDF